MPDHLRDWVMRRYMQLPESERREMAEAWKTTESRADFVIWDDAAEPIESGQ